MPKLILAALACGLTATLAACTSLRGATWAENGAPNGTFKGVLPDGQSGKTFIFTIHGMGATEDNYSNNLLTLIGRQYSPTKAVGYRPVAFDGGYQVSGEGLACSAAGGVCSVNSFGKYKIDRFQRGKSEVIVYTYFWNDSMWSFQEPYIKSDIARPRSVFNGQLKADTIDQGFTDAVAYLGELREPLRHGLEGAICAMLDEARNATPPPTTFKAHCLDDPERAALGEAHFNFISHSLGSRMLFDVLNPIESVSPETDQRNATRAALAERTDTFFMAANQLPFLAIGQVSVQSVSGSRQSEAAAAPARSALASGPTMATTLPSDACANLPGFFRLRCFSGSRLLEGPMDVVAFLDPDDLLGFQASSAMVSSNSNVRIIDIVHRNTPQILWAFADPRKAHDKELDEPKSQKLILCGGEISGKKVLVSNCSNDQ